MNINEFTLMVREHMIDYLAAYDLDDLCEKEIIKNNGVKYKALIIKLKSNAAAPTIYMDYYFGLYKQGKDFKFIMDSIYNNFKESVNKLEVTENNPIDLADYKDRIFIKAVNYEKNKERLEDCPFIPFLDMAITFRYLVSKDDKEISSLLIRNDLMDAWELNTHSLYKTAYYNTKKLFPPIVRKMSDVIKSYVAEDVFVPDNEMYVLTNECGINGAAYITYKEILEDFGKDIFCDFYIIPSSIHEIILIPKKETEDEEMLKMFVKGVNSTAIPKTDFLSDNVYLFTREGGIIII